MATVSDLMNRKSYYKNYYVESTDSVLDALELMAEANIGSVMVNEGDNIVGIFSERDYARKCELNGLAAGDTPLREVMTEKMLTVSLDMSIDQCMELMNRYHVRHLPVIEDGTMVGMVSMRDVVDILLADRESTIKGLENYILSTGFST
jgi:CBS domain-containing protein